MVECPISKKQEIILKWLQMELKTKVKGFVNKGVIAYYCILINIKSLLESSLQ